MHFLWNEKTFWHMKTFWHFLFLVFPPGGVEEQGVGWGGGAGWEEHGVLEGGGGGGGGAAVESDCCKVEDTRKTILMSD